MSLARLGLVILGLATPSETSILAQIQSLDQRLVQTETTWRQTVQRRDTAWGQLQAIEMATKTSRSQQAQAWEQFRRRIRSLARLPPSLTPALWKGAASFEEAVADTRLLRAIATHDRRLHQRLLAQGQALQALEFERQTQQRVLDNEVAEMQARRASLSQQRQQRRRLLQSIRGQKPVAAALGLEATAARQTLGAVVRAAPEAMDPATDSALIEPQKPPITGIHRSQADTHHSKAAAPKPLAAQRGVLAWPAKGPVRVAFGERIDLAYGTITSHNGWDIGAPTGSQVQAVAPGRVVYADWLRGYGQVVIVDHNDAYHAVVAHLASVQVAVGDTVAPGQTLGTVGDTGSLRGPVLYFELRHRGTPVDPKGWLRQ